MEDVLHDGHAHTALLLGYNLAVTAMNHPDADRREEYFDGMDDDHPQYTCEKCDVEYPIPLVKTVSCPLCGAELDDGPIYYRPDVDTSTDEE